MNVNKSEYVFQKQKHPPKKSDIFNLHSEPAVCFERLDTILMLLLLSRRGKAPLFNASLLTSIITWAESKSLVDRLHSANTDDSQPQWSKFSFHTPETVQSGFKYNYNTVSTYSLSSKDLGIAPDKTTAISFALDFGWETQRPIRDGEPWYGIKT